MHTTTHEQHGLRRSFDTELLEQIIEVEVDEAVRALRERKIIVDAEKQHHWNESLREILTHTAMEEMGTHCLLPAEFQESLQCMLKNLIDAEYGNLENKRTITPSTMERASFFERITLFLRRLIGQKTHP